MARSPPRPPHSCSQRVLSLSLPSHRSACALPPSLGQLPLGLAAPGPSSSTLGSSPASACLLAHLHLHNRLLAPVGPSRSVWAAWASPAVAPGTRKFPRSPGPPCLARTPPRCPANTPAQTAPPWFSFPHLERHLASPGLSPSTWSCSVCLSVHGLYPAGWLLSAQSCDSRLFLQEAPLLSRGVEAPPLCLDSPESPTLEGLR